jgi:hypothetical protein
LIRISIVYEKRNSHCHRIRDPLGNWCGFISGSQIKQEEKQNQTVTTHSNITPTVAITNVQIQGLEVDQPEDGSIVTKDTVTIQGKASKNSLIVIQTPIKDITLQVDKEQFSSELSLALGENVIRITVYPKDQSLRLKKRS